MSTVKIVIKKKKLEWKVFASYKSSSSVFLTNLFLGISDICLTLRHEWAIFNLQISANEYIHYISYNL